MAVNTVKKMIWRQAAGILTFKVFGLRKREIAQDCQMRDQVLLFAAE